MFGSAGWRGKIYSQGMVNKYCSLQQEGPHSFTSGRGGVGMGVCAGTCICACVFKCCCSHMKLPYSPSVHTTCSTPFFSPFTARGGVRREEKDQIGRADVVSLFMGITAVLSVILLHLICFLKGKGTDRVPRDQD